MPCASAGRSAVRTDGTSTLQIRQLQTDVPEPGALPLVALATKKVLGEDLLAAAKALANWKLYDDDVDSYPIAVRGVESRLTVSDVRKAKDAVAAAERELAERLKPIDDEWLSTIGREGADGWIINARLAVWYGEHCQEWLAMHTGAGTAIRLDGGRGQLLDLLDGRQRLEHAVEVVPPLDPRRALGGVQLAGDRSALAGDGGVGRVKLDQRRLALEAIRDEARRAGAAERVEHNAA